MSVPPFVFTVRQLTRYLRVLLERDRGLQAVWVKGEISDFTRHSSGHLYFSLKDETSRLRCAMFRNEAEALAFQPQEGMMVLACGRITIYEPAGQYQLVVEELAAEGVGALFLAFEALKKKLAAEGLFDEARKRPLPRYPNRIALLTSLDGAAIHDLVTVIRRRWPRTNLLVIPTPVQGPTAAAGILRSFQLLARCKGVDLAVLARGGGSPEELAPFNDERVARAIVNCPIPVVAAIGHEVDFTIADFTADLRAPTPSAAGEMVVPDAVQVNAGLIHLNSRMAAALKHRLESAGSELSLLLASRPFRYPLEIIASRAQQLDDVIQSLKEGLAEAVQTAFQRLDKAQARLEALSPLAVLKRGYAVVRKLPEARVVRSIKEISSGDKARIDFADGIAFAGIEEVRSQKGRKIRE
jgi:exodeoxyribonuclease VII large subunit